MTVRTWPGVLLALFFVCAVADRGAARDDEAQQPDGPMPQKMAFTVDGKTIDVAFGTPFSLTIGDKTVSCAIVPHETRVFRGAGYSFSYPRHFAYERDDEDPSAVLHSLDGNDVVFMLHDFAAPSHVPYAQIVANEILMQWGREEAKLTDTSLALGARTFPAKRIDVSVSGQRLAQLIMDWPAPGRHMVLVLQDTLDDDGSHTQEWRALIRTLGQSLSLK